jgi:hypothetical protein
LVYDPFMHPHIVEVLGHLDASLVTLRAAVDAIPPELRATRPTADRWSVAEIVEHLTLAERRFCARLRSAIADAQAAGLGAAADTRVPLPERVTGLLADRAVRRSAPDFLHPQGGMSDEDAWAALEQARGEFREMLAAVDGLALDSVTLDHPVLGTLTGYQWVEIVAGHQLRHAQQVREVAASLAAAN